MHLDRCLGMACASLKVAVTKERDPSFETELEGLEEFDDEISEDSRNS
jgi:hypothetical protein